VVAKKLFDQAAGLISLPKGRPRRLFFGQGTMFLGRGTYAGAHATALWIMAHALPASAVGISARLISTHRKRENRA
jgi:hypothetical protein